jgi:N-acetylneuraminic acid mutarotase
VTRRDQHAGTSTSTFGYLFGGYNDSSTYLNTIQKYQHSNDTYPTFTTTLWSGTVWTSTVAHNNTTLAFIVGGYNGSNVCNRYKVFTFSSETVSSDLTLSPEQGQSSVCGSQEVGYLCSGFTTGGTMTTTVQKFTFATQAWTTGTALSYSVRVGDGASSPVNGVIGGAFVGSFSIATAQTKIDYASDTYSTASQIYSVNTDTPGAWSSSQIQ